ncbi:acylphosphatase [Naasia sp. SYSU D00057]|uniref:acylphosphatase n=1 Tax=Naasia sp. SYSU D00057 TaxID=2817380 RepID=UPI001B30808F|nr:acylphosphatase [Naasia sp. SYSU D00057]
MTRVARRALVSGRVQGVGFRYSCVAEAQAIGVAGWVRNLPDGRVEAHVEGDEDSVTQLLAWLHEGPAFAEVTSVEVREADPIGAVRFSVA